jgi:hypothetical protein
MNLGRVASPRYAGPEPVRIGSSKPSAMRLHEIDVPRAPADDDAPSTEAEAATAARLAPRTPGWPVRGALIGFLLVFAVAIGMVIWTSQPDAPPKTNSDPSAASPAMDSAAMPPSPSPTAPSSSAPSHGVAGGTTGVAAPRSANGASASPSPPAASSARRAGPSAPVQPTSKPGPAPKGPDELIF